MWATGSALMKTNSVVRPLHRRLMTAFFTVASASVAAAFVGSYLASNAAGWSVSALVAGLAVGALASFVFARGSVHSLDAAIGARRQILEGFGRGRFAPRASRRSSDFPELDHALAEAGRDLEEFVGRLVRQRDESEAVLSSIAEGVVVVDLAASVISMNRAAADLLGLEVELPAGRSLEELFRFPELQRFVRHVLVTDSQQEQLLVLRDSETHWVQVRGAVVRTPDEVPFGAVVVLNDVTELRRLEQVRRDFVANVSHELRTPVTAIKGFLETLNGGALDDPANAKRFVEIAARQADRLGVIVDDLLMLSRLEESGDTTVELEQGRVEGVVSTVVDLCSSKADAKQIALVEDVAPGLSVRMSRALLEQALSNLVLNAINYSGPSTEVRIVARPLEEGARIDVCDQGPGIDERHLGRLFERFYRADKARSRGAGGTGLGLAIVKHVAQLHHGAVTVRSRPGKGSVFSLFVGVSPAAQDQAPE